MALISDLLDDYTQFPQTLDTWTTYQDGRAQANCTDAEIVNKIEAVVQKTQEYNQQTVRVVESPSVTGDRKRLKVTLDVVVGSTKKFHEYDYTLSAEQARFLGNDLFRAGNILLASAYPRSGSGAAVRCTWIPRNPTQIRLRLDNLDAGGSLAAGIYRVCLTVFGG